ncbi:MAG TPA: 1-acyl-sn-glycerol-3-phosphate acyltransferase, partial [Thermoanaerobaculia bacterium]|nr:1-acyl-sn-glycerol-3-phosphate acyltransferase [Thermoanaerobaculia bacterium]
VAAGERELATRRERAQRLLAQSGASAAAPGIAFRAAPLAGELAFVFTGGGAAYAGMGRELLLALPELLDRLGRRMRDLATPAGWVYGRGADRAGGFRLLDQLWGCSFLCQVHAELTRHLLGLVPAATLGYSSGESNALVAMGVWDDLDAMYRDTAECGVFTRHLAGEFAAVRAAWERRGVAGGRWENWLLAAPVAAVREALAGETLAHLTIVNTAEEVVIGGESASCRRVIARLAAPASPLGYDMAVHCPEVEEIAGYWLDLHRRPTREVDGVRFYTNATGRHYRPTRETAAQAILGQAVTTLDFPRLVEQAFDDGVRVFVEHGPRGLCSGWIRKVLARRGVAADAFLAVPLDRSGGSGLRQAAEVAAQLLAAGVPLRAGPFAPPPQATRPAARMLTFRAHWPAVAPPLAAAPAGERDEELGGEMPAPVAAAAGPQKMEAAPWLPPVVEEEQVGEEPAAAPWPAAVWSPAAPISSAAPVLAPVIAQMAALQARVAAVQREYLAAQSEVHQRFLAVRQGALHQLLAASQGATALALAAEPVPTPAFVAETLPVSLSPRPELFAVPAAAPPPISAPPAADSLPGPKLSRAELEILAGGCVSAVLGPLFAAQDAYRRQVRLPEPPLLLVDRVAGIAGEPGSMGLGTIWTETDVRADSWYLHDGYMPAGILIESGQADLLLISWLGVDALNRGERIYRLLGCELTYLGPLPRPGDTLRYDIHVDGHAAQGDVRLFFFHYDCRIDGEVRLSVRHGQAGFFTDQELAESAGVLWEADAEPPAGGRLDPPHRLSSRTRFGPAEVAALAAGRLRDALGAGFEAAQAHVRTPRIQAGPMLFLEQVTELDPEGGPWRRGYLAAEAEIHPQSWFFAGHFKDDPCMPGTLMFEGCLQAMAFYLAALGFTLERDGWRFEPVPGEPYTMRCRGQVVPGSRRLLYEVFVREVIAGPLPTLYADLLCTVDGLKAFHAQRVGLRLVPDWPLTSRPELVAAARAAGEAPGARPAAVVDGFTFDYLSLLACASGRPSDAFGPMYRVFDGARRVARLPGPPYHFMSRIAAIDGAMGRFEAGAVIEAEYDVPAAAWYFAENGAPTMPFAVLLEAGLQPCGWLASFVGSALQGEEDLHFRNLDGSGTLSAELLPAAGTLRTRVQLLGVSRSAGTIILRFAVECRLDGGTVFSMTTVFGFFTAAAFQNQVGLPPAPEEQAWLAAPSDLLVDLASRPARYCAGEPRLAGPELLMLDRISGFWPEGGRAGLGRLRGEKDVDPAAWYFKAHFFQDPVQPGSLGLEAMVQLLQFYMLHTGMAEGLARPRFEPLALGRPLGWKYRGQVLPTDRRVTVELEVVERGSDGRGAYAVADAWLWVDGRRIYAATGLGMRIVPGASAGEEAAPAAAEETLDPAVDLWLGDHRPTWTVPALPMMSIVDRLAAAAFAARPGLRVVGLQDVRLTRWVTFPGGPVRLRTETGAVSRLEDGRTAVDVALLVWRESASAALSRFEPAAAGRVLLAADFPPPPAPLPPLADAVPGEDPYASGALFHGPAFHLLRRVSHGAAGSSALLDAGGGAVPRGALHQALLDAATHAVPHDDLERWCGEAAAGLAGYPQRIRTATFHGEPPQAGEVRCEARFLGFAAEGDGRLPVVRLQLAAGGRVWADLEMIEVLLPKGRLGTAPPAARRDFLRGRLPVPGVGLARREDGTTRLRDAEVAASDWLPGTVAAAYGAGAWRDDRRALTLAVAVKDHVAAAVGVHPATVAVAEDGESAVAAALPLTRVPVAVVRRGDEVEVRDAGAPWLDVSPLRDYWRRRLGIAGWPTEDLYYTLIERFVGRVVVADPEAFAAVRGRSLLFLANHQVGVESLLFSIVASGLAGLPTVTLAKAEHRTSWLGRLIALCFSWPGVEDPGVITFFERDDLRSLPPIIRALGADMRRGKSVMVHAEGTRALSCRHAVSQLSNSFVDMALSAEAPVVPVRFVGGLPPEELTRRLEFPLGYGRQDYWFGRPLLPEELRALSYRDRRAAVVAAINGLGPPNAEEAPLPPDPDFAAAVEAWTAVTGAAAEHAAVYRALERAARRYSPELERLLAMGRAGRWELGGDPAGRWLAELASRLYGRRGPSPQAAAEG